MTEAAGAILLVEDDEAVREAVGAVLRQAGHRVADAGSAAAAVRHLERHDAEVIVLDLGLPDADGLELLPRLLEIDDRATVVVMTGRDSIQTVVDAMKRGAETFLVKPTDSETLLLTIDRALRQHRLFRHAAVYRDAVTARAAAQPAPGRELIGSSPAMDRVRELLGRVAPTDASVVLGGESGTGKGVVARLIHVHSRRAPGPFVDLSCAALPSNLVESEIFGHEPGAFTDAKTRKPGLLEVGNGGTIFLDEVAELEAAAQGKLLKVIEERGFRRVGGVREVSVDVRFVVATHVNLREAVEGGTFRRDLFYRLNVFEILMPPLRERGEDVLELAYHFVGRLNPLLGRQVRRIAEPAAQLLLRYGWPGNVRELHNVVERALILASGDTITSSHLPEDIRAARPGDGPAPIKTLEEVEAAHIELVLRLTRSNVKLAAERLGISRSTLYAKLERYGLLPAADRGAGEGPTLRGE